MQSLDHWLEYIESVHPAEIDMGLTRIRTVARRLGVTRPAPQTVIVAGTNGKGSTAVALETLLMETDANPRIRVGTTLSPHVEHFSERIRIDAARLSDRELCRYFTEVEAARLGTNGDAAVVLTYFEFSALLALTAFFAAGVDVAILEVGLGGRLDAFNVVDADVAVVTSIGVDHVDYLGDDIQQIGREKAGVFRPGQAVVLGAVTDSVVDAARALDCRTLLLGEDFQVEEAADYWSFLGEPGGEWQRGIPRGGLAPVNCALAACTAGLLLTTEQQLPLASLSDVRFEGRMERLQLDDALLIVDVAHNPAGARFLARQLELRFVDRSFVAIFGSLSGKDAVGVATELKNCVQHWLTIDTAGPRGQSAAELTALLASADVASESVGNIAGALARARALLQPPARPGSATQALGGILIFGSFSAVEQAKVLLSRL